MFATLASLYAALQGYKTIIGMGLAFACALWQVFVGPLPVVDAKEFAVVSTALGVVLRFLTKTPVGQKQPAPPSL